MANYRNNSSNSTNILNGCGMPATKLVILIFICESYHYYYNYSPVSATSINYGISQQPITDINQLMPKLCQNQSVICENSFCIPGVRKCVCDLRMPVQLGRFCLRQVDIETKCFVTSQCNHTVKDAVCIDINSNAILDTESSKFKLDQWQQLNELRQASQMAQSSDTNRPTIDTNTNNQGRVRFLVDRNNVDEFNFEARADVIVSNIRNSPYEINYSTPELMLQNHTRRRTNNSDRSFDPRNFIPTPTPAYNGGISETQNDTRLLLNDSAATPKPTERIDSQSPFQTITTSNEPSISRADVTNQPQVESTTTLTSTTTTTIATTTTTTTTTIDTTTVAGLNESPRKKMVVKAPNWPPGICSCPFGFMFDSMSRKCLALSLADSHCQTDNDCKQISSTHCSSESKKCDCDEPLIWNQTNLACVRPKPRIKIENQNQFKENPSDDLLANYLLAKLPSDQSILLLFFVIIVIIATLFIMKMTVKCFSTSSGSALISPKNKKKKPSANNNLPPRSPYATLRRQDQKPTSQLSSFTQAARGRILNYDFEQECPDNNEAAGPSRSPQPSTNTHSRKADKDSSGTNKGGTLSKVKAHKHQAQTDANSTTKGEEADDQLMELNDNISVSQMESESKSDNSTFTIPGPPPTQPPPYMLASAMKGQGSAIAAAAAAVANRRIQMAQKKNLAEQQASGRLANGSPVFL